MPVKTKEHHLLDRLTPALPIFLGAGLLLCGKQVSAAVSESLTLCIQILLPSLFPFFSVSALLCSGGGQAPVWVGKLMERLFGLPGSMAPALLLGAVGGYPVGARTVCQLYERGICRKEQAVSALRFCCNAGPAFVVSALGSGLLGDGKTGWLLWFIHIASALMLGLLFRTKSSCVKADDVTPFSQYNTSGTALFLQAVTGSAATFLNVCAFVVFFAVLTCLLEQIPVLTAFPPLPTGLLYGFLELTGGAVKLIEAALPRRALLTSLSFLCGWGGLSVQCQTMDLLQKADLPCRGYLMTKLLHGAVAAALTLLIST